jgi:hypothetical protein
MVQGIERRAESVQETEAAEKEEISLITASCGESLSCNGGVEWNHPRHRGYVY